MMSPMPSKPPTPAPSLSFSRASRVLAIVSWPFQGVAGATLVLILTWVYGGYRERRALRRSAADVERTKDLAEREMLETIYSALITADPTPLQPSPPPGLIDKVDNLDAKLESDRETLISLLTEHAVSDEKNFAAISEAIQRLS